MSQRLVVCSLAVLLAFVLLAHQSANAECNNCGTNGIACINETSFYMCYKEAADSTQTFTCPTGTVCTRTSLKCVDKTLTQPDCTPNKGCGICGNGKMFACTSRTTFAQCNGDQLTAVTGKCPAGMLCDSTGVEICVDDCTTPLQIECNRESPQ